MFFSKELTEEELKKLIQDLKDGKKNANKQLPLTKKKILQYQDKHKDNDIIYDGAFNHLDRPRKLSYMEKLAIISEKKRTGRKYSLMELRYKSLESLRIIGKEMDVANVDIKDRNRIWMDIFKSPRNTKR